MRRGLKIGLAFFALLCALGGGAGMVWTAARGTTDPVTMPVQMEKTVNADAVETIIVHTDMAGMTVVPSSDNSVHIRLSGKVLESEREAADIREETSGDTATFEIRSSKRIQVGLDAARLLSLLRGEGLGGVQVEVALPAKRFRAIELATDTGGIRIGKGASASELQLESDTGGVRVEGADFNRLTIRNGTGGVSVNGVASGATAIHIDTDTGGIRVASDTLASDLTLHSDTGGIEVQAGKAASLGVDLKSGTGRTEADLPGIRYEVNEKHRVVGSIGGGKPAVKATTSTGSIVVTTR